MSSYWWDNQPKSYPEYRSWTGHPLGPFDQEFNEALELPTGYPLPPFSEEFDETVAARLKAMSKDQPPVPAEEEKK